MKIKAKRKKKKENFWQMSFKIKGRFFFYFDENKYKIIFFFLIN